MGRPIKDRASVRYGKLIARYVAAQSLQKEALWYCDCDCGGYTVALGSKIESGEISSCGCLIGEVRRLRPQKSLNWRFWDKVFPSGPLDCWEWIGAVDPETGYGRIGAGERSKGILGAHVVSYTLHHGDIPEGKEICHTCDNRWCVNPWHLYAGTRQENVNDMMRRNRHHSQKVDHEQTEKRV